jgi:hypothetical protein
MKTCKTGCGKMQAGGSVKKVKKMQTGGGTDMLGMPQYSNNPRTYSGRMLKKGGAIKKYQDGGDLDFKKKPALYTKSAKAGAGIIGSGLLGIAAKFVVDKIQEKNAAKAAKKAAEEKKKKESATPKAKFGSSVSVQRSPKPGKITGVDGGYAKIGMREPARNKFAKGGFPDLNKDGKVTKADILKGRGVIKKKGGAVKKK